MELKLTSCYPCCGADAHLSSRDIFGEADLGNRVPSNSICGRQLRRKRNVRRDQQNDLYQVMIERPDTWVFGKFGHARGTTYFKQSIA